MNNYKYLYYFYIVIVLVKKTDSNLEFRTPFAPVTKISSAERGILHLSTPLTGKDQLYSTPIVNTLNILNKK